VCYCSCFFVRLQFEFLDLSKFGALLAPLGCAIHGVPYLIAFSDGPFSWSLYQEYIGLHYSFIAFPFIFCLLTLM
jgi:hypothetical protein